MRKHWLDSDDPRRFQRGLFGSMTLWIFGIVAVILAVGAVVWALSVGTSGVKGEGNALREKNSAENWVEAQREFNIRYQDILSTDRKITDAKAARDADPQNAVLQTNYNGLVNYCSDAAASYNALSRSYLAEDFRDADLPAMIDPRNPETDCKENN